MGEAKNRDASASADAVRTQLDQYGMIDCDVVA